MAVLCPGVALAADAYSVPISTQGAGLPVYDAPSGFDWNGFYAGVFGSVQASPDYDTQLGVGFDVGVNAQFDFFLVGGEVAIQGLTGDTFDTAYGQVLGRAGLLLTDQVLVYAAAGFGADLSGTGETDALLGGGVELAVTEDLTVGAQYLRGFDLEGGNPKDQVTLGAKFHF
ncbi:outer membrane protein [Devosia sp.]|uniref:outer membrane protein n=1 Tax=Devosia sp. TaxID=1871048 RepID=UPI003A904619